MCCARSGLEAAITKRDHIVVKLEAKISGLRTEIDELRSSSRQWRAKCIETLDALDTATAALSTMPVTTNQTVVDVVGSSSNVKNDVGTSESGTADDADVSMKPHSSKNEFLSGGGKVAIAHTSTTPIHGIEHVKNASDCDSRSVSLAAPIVTNTPERCIRSQHSSTSNIDTPSLTSKSMLRTPSSGRGRYPVCAPKVCNASTQQSWQTKTDRNLSVRTATTTPSGGSSRKERGGRGSGGDQSPSTKYEVTHPIAVVTTPTKQTRVGAEPWNGHFSSGHKQTISSSSSRKDRSVLKTGGHAWDKNAFDSEHSDRVYRDALTFTTSTPAVFYKVKRGQMTGAGDEASIASPISPIRRNTTTEPDSGTDMLSNGDGSKQCNEHETGVVEEEVNFDHDKGRWSGKESKGESFDEDQIPILMRHLLEPVEQKYEDSRLCHQKKDHDALGDPMLYLPRVEDDDSRFSFSSLAESLEIF